MKKHLKITIIRHKIIRKWGVYGNKKVMPIMMNMTYISRINRTKILFFLRRLKKLYKR